MGIYKMIKCIKKVLIALIILMSIIIISPFFIFPVLNDMKAEKLANELRSAQLPDKTEIIEVLSGCGNTSGAGNHTEIWAGMLIKTELLEQDILEIFGTTKVQKVSSDRRYTFIMGNLDKSFSSLNNRTNLDGYYIIEWVDGAVSSFFDLRGH